MPTTTAALKAELAKFKKLDAAKDAELSKLTRDNAARDKKIDALSKIVAGAAGTQTAKKLTHREEIVRLAWWFHEHGAQMPYTESAERQNIFQHPKMTSPNELATDCSGFVTLLYAWADCHDPNGINAGTFHPGHHWTQLGYTGTLLDYAQHHGEITTIEHALPGDLVVVGPGTGDHVMVAVTHGPDPVCIGHGSKGITVLHASQDGREPHRVCQYILEKK